MQVRPLTIPPLSYQTRPPQALSSLFALTAHLPRVAERLRAKGHSVDLQLIPGKKIAWCYNYADRIGAARAVLVAPDEWSQGLVRVKDLRKGETDAKEVNIKFEDL